MGAFLDKPDTNKKTSSCVAPNGIVVAVSEMQGWRVDMEVRPARCPRHAGTQARRRPFPGAASPPAPAPPSSPVARPPPPPLPPPPLLLRRRRTRTRSCWRCPVHRAVPSWQCTTATAGSLSAALPPSVFSKRFVREGRAALHASGSARASAAQPYVHVARAAPRSFASERVRKIPGARTTASEPTAAAASPAPHADHDLARVDVHTARRGAQSREHRRRDAPRLSGHGRGAEAGAAAARAASLQRPLRPPPLNPPTPPPPVPSPGTALRGGERRRPQRQHRDCDDGDADAHHLRQRGRQPQRAGAARRGDGRGGGSGNVLRPQAEQPDRDGPHHGGGRHRDDAPRQWRPRRLARAGRLCLQAPRRPAGRGAAGLGRARH